MKKILFSAALVCSQLFSNAQEEVKSCDSVCTCTDFVIPSGVMIGRLHSKGEWMLNYRYMSMMMDGMLEGSSSANSNTVFNNYLMAPETMHMNMHMFMAMYGVSDRVTLMLMGGFNSTEMHMEMFSNTVHNHDSGTEMHGSEHHMNSSGIADLKLYGMYGLYGSGSAQLNATLGVNFPLAKTQNSNFLDPFYRGGRLPYAMQNGSGTFDLLPGISYFRKTTQFSYGTQLVGVIRFGSSVFGYRRGNEVQANIWLGWRRWKVVQPSVRLESLLASSIIGADRGIYIYNEPDANPVNSGYKRVNACLGMQIIPFTDRLPGATVSLEYGLPVYQHVNGLQMSSSNLLNFSLNYTF